MERFSPLGESLLITCDELCVQLPMKEASEETNMIVHSKDEHVMGNQVMPTLERELSCKTIIC